MDGAILVMALIKTLAMQTREHLLALLYLAYNRSFYRTKQTLLNTRKHLTIIGRSKTSSKEALQKRHQ